jgi:hypothetical protein
MWNMECFVIPVIIGATGIVTRGLKEYLETIPGKHSIDSVQETAVLGTSHIMRKVLQPGTSSLSSGVHHGSGGKVPGKTCEKRRRNNNKFMQR